MEPDRDRRAYARLRAARPESADVDPHAFDAELLARLTAAESQPARRRSRRRALAGLAASAIAAAVVLIGSSSGPHTTGSDTAVAAVRRAAAWFALPPAHILHYRAVIIRPRGPSRVVEEVWESTDTPSRFRRLQETQAGAAEIVGDSLYDPARNTIYRYLAPTRQQTIREARSIMGRKIVQARAAGDESAVRSLVRVQEHIAAYIRRARIPETVRGPIQPGKTNVALVWHALKAGKATAGPEVAHEGMPSRPITLDIGDHVRWRLWTAVDDGRPLEIVIDHGPRTTVEERTTFKIYELLPARDDARLLTLRGAHPDARTVVSRNAYVQAQARLLWAG